MKNINELSELELLNLTKEEIKAMIKYSMAEAGIPIYEKPIEPNYEVIPAHDTEVYEVQGITNYFANKELAEQISKLIRDNIEEMVTIDYETKAIKNLNEWEKEAYFGVKPKKAYSLKLSSEFKDKLKSNLKLREEYERLVKVYSESYSQAESIRDEIHMRIQDAQERKEERELAQKRFSQYMEIANNDYDMAEAFFYKAFPNTPSEVRSFLEYEFKKIEVKKPETKKVRKVKKTK